MRSSTNYFILAILCAFSGILFALCAFYSLWQHEIAYFVLNAVAAILFRIFTFDAIRLSIEFETKEI